MKKIALIVFLFLLNISSVYAKGFRNIRIDGYIDDSTNYYFLRSGYKATVEYDDGTSKNSVAFCLDPGLNLPESVTVGEVGSESIYYKQYLLFYNNLCKDNSQSKNQRKYFQAAARATQYKLYIDEQNGDINPLLDFTNEMEIIIGNRGTTNEFTNDELKEIRKYYNVSDDDIAGLKGKYRDPSITFSEVEGADGGTIKFDFNWDDLLDSNVYKEVDIGNGGLIKSPNLQVVIYLKNNNSQLARIASDRDVNDYIKKVKYGDDYVEIAFNVEQIRNLSGDINIDFNYEWSHPLNPDNLKFGNVSDSSFQKMLIITDRKESNYVSYKLEPTNFNLEELEHNNVCMQNGDEFYYQDNNVVISEFISNCGCGLVDQTKLSEETNKSVFTDVCGYNLDADYFSSFGLCKIDNEVTRNVVASVSDTGNYCKFIFNEKLNFQNFFSADSLSVIAGETFKTNDDENPIIVDIDSVYTLDYENENLINIKNDVKNILTDLVAAYNGWQEYESVKDTDNHEVGIRQCCGMTIGDSCMGGWGNKMWYSYNKYTLKTDLTIEKNIFRGSYSSCAGISSINVKENFREKFVEYYGKLEKLKQEFEKCNTFLNDFDNNYQYNESNLQMDFYYEQQYEKYGVLLNNNRPNNIDDSKLSTKEERKSSTTSFIEHEEITFQELNNDGTIQTNSFDIKGKKVNHKMSFSFKPIFKKYSDNLVATIDDSHTSKNYLIENLYDIDVSALSKDNNISYYTFSKLGSDFNHNSVFVDSILKYYQDRDDDDTEGIDKVTRACDYKITNEIVTTCIDDCCNDGSCPDFDYNRGTNELESSLNVIYRTVEPSRIDPNGRLTDSDDTNGFDNWNNVKGIAVMNEIENTARATNTYAPSNLEYSFTLDSAKISEIRSSNVIDDVDVDGTRVTSRVSYDSFNNITCINGLECKSAFVDEYASKKDGRIKWKYMTYDEISNSWSIDRYNSGEMTEEKFNSYKEMLGGITP